MTWQKGGGNKMVITRTPLRLEFLGGSTDAANFYSREVGRVLNATLDKYIYVIVKPRFDHTVKVIGEEAEIAESVDELKHKYTRAALQMFGIKNGIEVVSVSDIHTKGSGLGSSSSYAVGLINALATYSGKKLTPEELGEMACHLEIDILGEPIGKQDQFAAAVGGVSHMVFNKDGKVDVQPVKLSEKIQVELENQLVVFYTGKSRSSSNIMGEQAKNFERIFPLLKQMRDLVPGSAEALQKGNLPEFADFLYREWTIKKGLTPEVTNVEIEEMYKKAVKAGAMGGRVSGAGGGGFLYVLAPVAKHAAIERALSGYKRVEFKFTPEGSKVIYSTMP
jgi:D-glycero-alpha-D-manno-heptose-7-phosphate kinase